MTSFDQVLESQSKIPTEHVVLKAPDAFASDWSSNKIDVALGFRRISDNDFQTARAEAAKYAISMHDDREGQIEAFNDALMRWLVVRGTCDSNDVTLNAPLFEGSEENVRLALTPQSIRYVWDRIEKYHIENSPLSPEVTDVEIIELTDLLINMQAMTCLSSLAQKRMRKLLGYCLVELRECLADLPDQDQGEVATDV